MAKLIIIEDNTMLCNVFSQLLDKHTNFDYKIAKNYKQAKALLQKNRYEFAIADINISDVHNREIIPLLNKYNIAPIVFTDSFDEDFIEAFESAHIVDYFLKEGYENILSIIEKLKQLQANKNKTVLVVHSYSLYATYLKQNFVLHHFKVLTASNAQEALEKLQNHPEVELVVTDYNIPVMDGLEFVKAVRKTKPKKDLKIIVTTVESHSFIISRFLKEGANDYITKPFSRDEFYTRVYQNIESVS